MNLQIVKNDLEIFDKKLTEISNQKPFTQEWEYYHNSIRSVLTALNILNDMIVEKDNIITQNFRDNLKMAIESKRLNRININLEKENRRLNEKCLSLEKQINEITSKF
jgi:hypothetical protein